MDFYLLKTTEKVCLRIMDIKLSGSIINLVYYILAYRQLFSALETINAIKNVFTLLTIAIEVHIDVISIDVSMFWHSVHYW